MPAAVRDQRHGPDEYPSGTRRIAGRTARPRWEGSRRARDARRCRELEARADIDPLTDIFNRRGFERELKRSLAYVKRYGTRAALIYLDLDGFKPVNDRHGHAAGDAVLKAVAAMLARKVRASDVVARIGGDEFAVILWNLEGHAGGSESASGWKRRSPRSAIRTAWRLDRRRLPARRRSLGEDEFAADVLARADQAMYARKAARKPAPALDP